jgi:hypothetical protein
LLLRISIGLICLGDARSTSCERATIWNNRGVAVRDWETLAWVIPAVRLDRAPARAAGPFASGCWQRALALLP